MAESWLSLSPDDQREALEVAAAASGWPAYLLEKDIWVVWALQCLGADERLRASLTFKGGTSLSKAHRLIERFSEDIDLNLNIQHLWPEVDRSPAENPTQAQVRRKTADRRLRQWVQDVPLPLLQLAAGTAGVPLDLSLNRVEAQRRQPPTLFLRYQPRLSAPDESLGYVRPTVLLEFSAHSTGEPHQAMPITCEAAAHLPMLVFPAATPLVMDPRRTFLEKAAAIHVACRRGRWGRGDGERYSRHWYDLDRLDRAGIAEAAMHDRSLAMEVAQYKEDFWRAPPIDYVQALSGDLQLVPTGDARKALEADYRAMSNSGLLRAPYPSFSELMERIDLLAQRCNAAIR